MKNRISKEWIIIIILAFVKLGIHLIVFNNYELHRDALLYFSLGENPDWGYVSVPPLIAFISRFSTLIFGQTTFALRFFPALIGSVSVIIIAKIVKELNGSLFAIVIAALAFIFSPAFLRSNSLFQPVSFNQFFWLLSGYLIIKLLRTANPKIWISIFIVWGIAFLNKYSVAFFIVSSLLAILLTGLRSLIKSKHFFIGGAIGILIILPNILWQYSHNWPLMHHMSELQRYQFANVTIAGFIIDQFIMNFPGLIIWMTGLIVFLFFKPEKQYRPMAYTFLFTVLIILILHGKSYYTLGLYSILFALGGYAVDKYFKPYLKYVSIALVLLISIPMLPLSLPIYSLEKMENFTKKTAEFTNRWEDGDVHNLPQDYADMTGWKELSSIVIQQYLSLPKGERDSCLIYAENYGQAGAINFYGKKFGLPKPICFNDNFLQWAPDSVPNASMIYVNHEVGDIEFLFNSYKKIGQVNNKYFRENGLQVYYCSQPRDTFRIFYSGKVNELKSFYR
ncbi:MAG: glycosyltransferase family 39 protein [Bacteroidales bacterium]|nr:glycosyltransferase family 39 protein [Bacteroidales bacterium]